MANWEKVLAHIATDIENQYDQFRYRLGERLGRRDPIVIRPYRGYGSKDKLYLKGRVIENEGITPPEDNDSLWENLLNMYRRFESDEIPHARVLATFQGVEQEVVADEEGFFEFQIQPAQPLPTDKLWHQVKLELLEPQRKGQPPASAEGQVFVPPPGAQYGVISDIDDTVLQTDAAHLLRMARNVFLGNARTRLPFKGVGAFYRALFKGVEKEGTAEGGAETCAFNPLFYVSSSPWNLYELLSEFFQLQDIPIGPILFLRDWGLTEEEILPIHHRQYKVDTIKSIVEFYRDLPFILIGDSGQEDPEVYAEVVKLHPKRIQAIYIRNVSRDLKRPEAIRLLAKKVAEAGSTLILADDTVPMAEHAAEQGWIAASALPDIREEKKADEAPPSPVEKLLGEEEKAEAPTVVVETESPKETKAAVEGGVIEDALEIGKGETKEPPAVVVKGDSDEA
jgi:phosphatidate phosphatase APP1